MGGTRSAPGLPPLPVRRRGGAAHLVDGRAKPMTTATAAASLEARGGEEGDDATLWLQILAFGCAHAGRRWLPQLLPPG